MPWNNLTIHGRICTIAFYFNILAMITIAIVGDRLDDVNLKIFCIMAMAFNIINMLLNLYVISNSIMSLQKKRSNNNHNDFKQVKK